MNIRHKNESILNRLDHLPPWAFIGVLYIIRWPVIYFFSIPVDFILVHFARPTQAVEYDGSPTGLFIDFIIISPLLETLIECSLPYGVMWFFNIIPGDKRPWSFVCISAAIMALLHFFAWPFAIIPSLITGVFLAYVYGHFAPRGFGYSLLYTSAFHAAINIIGWLMIIADL
jgi:hypothetical protein